MSHILIEFKDFEYIKENVLVTDKVVKFIYVKVLKTHKEYLGSFKIGLYSDIDGENLKKCISDIVHQNFPNYAEYLYEITTKN
jgi:hypothetical protein